MKKILIVLTLILFLFPILAFADDAAAALFASIGQLSTDELVQLRELVDAELELREVAIPMSPAYVLNVNTRKFHFPSCNSVQEIMEKNKLDFYGEREELIEKEYAPCKRCKP